MLLGITERLEFVDAPGHVEDLVVLFIGAIDVVDLWSIYWWDLLGTVARQTVLAVIAALFATVHMLTLMEGYDATLTKPDRTVALHEASHALAHYLFGGIISRIRSEAS